MYNTWSYDNMIIDQWSMANGHVGHWLVTPGPGMKVLCHENHGTSTVLKIKSSPTIFDINIRKLDYMKRILFHIAWRLWGGQQSLIL